MNHGRRNQNRLKLSYDVLSFIRQNKSNVM